MCGSATKAFPPLTTPCVVDGLAVRTLHGAAMFLVINDWSTSFWRARRSSIEDCKSLTTFDNLPTSFCNSLVREKDGLVYE